MNIFEISREMDKLILLYIEGEDCSRQMEEQRQKLNNAIAKIVDEEEHASSSVISVYVL